MVPAALENLWLVVVSGALRVRATLHPRQDPRHTQFWLRSRHGEPRGSRLRPVGTADLVPTSRLLSGRCTKVQRVPVIK